MTAHTPPEILETDLSPLLLELAAWGATDYAKLDWLDAPPEHAVAAAHRLLAELDAFDASGRITALGREMMRLPLHPRLGRLLLRSVELGFPQTGCDLAALLSERDVFRSTRGEMCGLASHSDVSDRMEALQKWRAKSQKDDRLDLAALKNVERVVSQLVRLVKCPPAARRMNCDDDTVSRLLLAAYPDRLARRRSQGDASYLLVNGRGASLSHRSAVRNAEYIIAVALDGGSQVEAVIQLASEISEDILREERSCHIIRDSTVSWSDREARVAAVRQECLGAIKLSAEPFIPSDEIAVPVVLEAVRASALKLLNLDDRLLQFQGRMALVRFAFPGGGWPDISDAGLLNTLEDWLAPHLNGIRSAGKLAQLDVADLLKQRLDYRQQREFDELAPTHLTAPSGSRIRLDYSGESAGAGGQTAGAVRSGGRADGLSGESGCAAAPVITGRKADPGHQGSERVLERFLSPG